MSLNVFWFLPTHGDGHYLGSAQGAQRRSQLFAADRPAADRLGFGGVLIPTGRSCEDSAGGRLADPGYPAAEVFGRAAAGIISYAGGARAATLDRLSNGRALFNLVTGGDPEELAAEGCTLAMKSATKPQPSSPISGAGCWKAKPSISTASIFR